MQYEVVENTLVISIEDEKDREFIQDTLDNERNDLQALDDLCDGHTGWLGNQGPAPQHTEDNLPAVALGLEYDENGVPRWDKRFYYAQAEALDWRDDLLQEGTVTLLFYDRRR